jgi:hypothetical protein
MPVGKFAVEVVGIDLFCKSKSISFTILNFRILLTIGGKNGSIK